MEPLTKADLLDALSAFATREELRQDIRREIRIALEPYATRDEMREEIRVALLPYPTRVQMNEAIQTALQPYATREEMRADIRVSEDETRLYFRVVGEGLRDEIRLVAEAVADLSQRVETGFREVRVDLAALDRRVTRLEARKA